MRLKIKNIGIIKDADIKLDGLTVIAGENDTGKSTIGKIIFTISKSLSNYKNDFEQDRINFALRNMEQLYFYLRKNLDYGENIEIKNMFNIRTFHEELIRNGNDRDMMNKIINFKIAKIEELFKNDDGRKQNYIELLHEILEQFNIVDDNRIIRNNISKIMSLEFKGQVTNYYNDNGYIEFSEGKNRVLNLKIDDKSVKELEIFDEFSFRDATYIETPFVMQYKDMLLPNRSMYKKNNMNAKVPYHTTDLISKIQLSDNPEEDYQMNVFDSYDNKNRKLIDEIRKIIKGNMQYDKKKLDYVFLKYNEAGHKEMYSSDNTASGIKAFGLIQMLLNSEFISNTSILIIDEPEVHLHPKWQIEYSKIIVELVKNGIPVLVNTHSPYMLQALKLYSKELEKENIVNYYLADKDSNYEYTEIEDVTNSLNKAFKKLSDPFQELVWS